eukprot:g31792.t1
MECKSKSRESEKSQFNHDLATQSIFSRIHAMSIRVTKCKKETTNLSSSFECSTVSYAFESLGFWASYTMSNRMVLVKELLRYGPFEAFGVSWFTSQIPYFFFFVASLQEIPADVALLRVITCYVLPMTLFVVFSKSVLLGLLAVVVLFYAFTEANAAFPIR